MNDSLQRAGALAGDDDDECALDRLPNEWGEPVAFFCMTKLYLLKTQGPLCANLRYWIAKGLTLVDAKAIFRRLCDPEFASRHKFESDLMTDLADLVAEALRRRRQLADTKQRQEADRNAASAAGHCVRLADLFKGVK